MGERTGDVELSNMRHDASVQSEFEQKRQRKRRRCTCLACCGACGVLVVLIALILVALAFTVFKPKKPKLHVERITVEDFDGNVLLTIPPSVSLNITLGLVVSVENPNKAAFRFYNSTAFVYYRDVEVGSLPIPAGNLGAGDTTQVSTSLKLLADRLLSDRRVFTDFIAGSLPVSTTASISGQVNILNIFKRHVDTSTVCNASISPLNRKKMVEDLVCRYDIKI